MSDILNEVEQDKLIDVLETPEEVVVEVEVPDTGVEGEAVSAEPERSYSELELEALEMGWNPKGPKSAEVWVSSAPLYKKISESNKTQKKLAEQNDKLAQEVAKLSISLEKTKLQEYNKAMNELRAAKDEAIEAGSKELVARIEKEMESVPKPEVSTPVVPPQITDAVKQATDGFFERNSSWINDGTAESASVFAYAQAKDRELYKAHPNRDPFEHIQILETEIKAYRDKISGNVTQNRHIPAVEAGTAPASKVKRFTINNLDDLQKEACRGIVKTGLMTEAQYIKALVELGELK